MSQSLSMSTQDRTQTALEICGRFEATFNRISQEKGISREEAADEFIQRIHEAVWTPSSSDKGWGCDKIETERVSKGPAPDAKKVDSVQKVETLKPKEEEPSFEDILARSCSSRHQQPVITLKGLSLGEGVKAMNSMILFGGLSREQVLEIHDFLIKNPGAFEKFLLLEGESPKAQNIQFEKFLGVMDEDILNEGEGRALMEEVGGFAFSAVRFEWIQIQDDEIGLELNQVLIDYEQGIQSKDVKSDIQRFRSKSSQAFLDWQTRRMSGSNSISQPRQNQRSATHSWVVAEKKMQTKAAEAGNLSFGVIQKIHAPLTQNQSDIKNPGQLRHHHANSGLARERYPIPGENLEEQTQSYGRWLDSQVKDCQGGRKSVILTAAQAYQRLVSIHPFENGNGRVSRLMMDFVLIRCGLPPADLGSNVNDALFAFKEKPSAEAAQAFVTKVFEGVQRSHKSIQG